MNFFLNPLNRKVPSYLEDTRHMLCKVREINQRAPLPKTTRLIAIDAVAMYPSIPPEGGVAASERALLRSVMAVNKVNWLVREIERLQGKGSD